MGKLCLRWYIAIAIVLCPAASFPAEQSAAGAEDSQPSITRSQADSILDELRQIRHLLEGQAKPSSLPAPPQLRSLKLQGGYTLGSEKAPVTMVEFTDYQCPFCRGFEKNTFDQIQKLYIDTGKVRFITRNLPLDIHPDAMRSAEAALCTGDQGQFWPMRDFLFQSPSLAAQLILDSAQTFKLDLAAFRTCIEGEKHKEDILTDVKDAQALQIHGTPAFLIGKTTSYGVEGYVTTGALPFAQFDAKLKASEAP